MSKIHLINPSTGKTFCNPKSPYPKQVAFMICDADCKTCLKMNDFKRRHEAVRANAKTVWKDPYQQVWRSK